MDSLTAKGNQCILAGLLLPPTSETVVRFPAWPQVAKLVVVCCWSAVYSTDPNEPYVLVSSALPTTHRDMTCTVLKVT